MALVTTLAMTVMTLCSPAAHPPRLRRGHAGAGATAGSFTRIAHNPQGFASSKITGRTAKGNNVTGYFTPMKITKKNGHLRVRGLVSGVVHKGAGTSRTFSAVRTFRVSPSTVSPRQRHAPPRRRGRPATS